mmetsp:Transcript_27701/g.58292  ORF Transcript_27701/g.58292 Transcript_27701/m.58292 type:complete len:114 (+) Transcript_27701:361-702(+)
MCHSTVLESPEQQSPHLSAVAHTCIKAHTFKGARTDCFGAVCLAFCGVHLKPLIWRTLFTWHNCTEKPTAPPFRSPRVPTSETRLPDCASMCASVPMLPLRSQKSWLLINHTF